MLINLPMKFHGHCNEQILIISCFAVVISNCYIKSLIFVESELFQVVYIGLKLIVLEYTESEIRKFKDTTFADIEYEFAKFVGCFASE